MNLRINVIFLLLFVFLLQCQTGKKIDQLDNATTLKDKNENALHESELNNQRKKLTSLVLMDNKRLTDGKVNFYFINDKGRFSGKFKGITHLDEGIMVYHDAVIDSLKEINDSTFIFTIRAHDLFSPIDKNRDVGFWSDTKLTARISRGEDIAIGDFVDEYHEFMSYSIYGYYSDFYYDVVVADIVKDSIQ